METQVINATEYRNVSLSLLTESQTNPRRTFQEVPLKELAESIRSQGVLSPLLVRPLTENGFEIVAGARRYRAAQIAEMATVPVRIVNLTDAAALEAQLVENLIRSEIHPMEEAQGFRALLDLEDPKYSIEQIAAKVGKTPTFVAQRLKLADLAPAAVEAFYADAIGVGHALLLAKLPAERQEQALKACFKEVYANGDKPARILLPVRNLQFWIATNVLLILKDAPFNKRDAQLVPTAGSCADCPKRTGHNKLLFGDDLGRQGDQCTDPTCYQSKVDAHVAKTVAAAVFHRGGHTEVAEIGDAYKLLAPMLGTAGASVMFAIALLASGQNSTITGTLAGQVVMEGFLNITLPGWLRRLITRSIAIVPAVLVTGLYGKQGTGRLLLLSQAILSMQLSFAVFPLVAFTSSKVKMGAFVNGAVLRILSYSVAVIIAGLNVWLLIEIFLGKS